VAVDRDAVVVPESGQLAELPGAGQRAGFVADAFHQAAVADEYPGAVIHDGVTIAVEFFGEQLFSERHAHGIGDALTQRARGRFHADGMADFRVARRLGMQLAEGFQVVDRHVIAGQVQQTVVQH